MQPMRLLRIPEAFDHPGFIYELKLDGFRGLADVHGGKCRLISRNGHHLKRWPALCASLARGLRCESAVLDGEIACFDPNGRADFYGLLFGRRPAHFCAFDVLEIDGQDLRELSLLQRKRRLRAILPRNLSDVRYVDHVRRRGTDFFRLACARDLEGIVAKWAKGRYQTGHATSWLKIKNPAYSQMEGRQELFESRRSTFEGRRARTPQLLTLHLQ